MKWSDLNPKLKQRLINENPETLDANGIIVAPQLRASKSKSDQRREGEDKGVETGAGCARFRVVFTVYRKRLLDSGDNDASALKPIRDRTAERLGYPNDSGKYFLFEYHQIQSSTVQGTHILILPL